MQERGLNGCPMCRRRLAGKVPVKATHLAEGEPDPAPDQCPDCGAEWPMLVVETPVHGPFLVLSPLPYDPLFAGKAE